MLYCDIKTQTNANSKINANTALLKELQIRHIISSKRGTGQYYFLKDWGWGEGSMAFQPEKHNKKNKKHNNDGHILRKL